MNTTHGIGEEFKIYTRRFSDSENSTRSITWQVLCREFLQRFVKTDGVIVDIGAGDGHFLLNIQAKTKIAVDLSPHTKVLESHGVNVLLIPATEMSAHIHEKVDLIFMSNFLEHLPDKRTLLEVFKESKKILKPGGTLMILQPNIRYVGPAYWDYIDHHIALTEHSLQEALNITGFEVDTMIPRFLPYTVRSGVGQLAEGKMTKFLVSTYLKIPLLWRIFGKQTFITASARP